jgi:hypothetical protein
MIVIPAHDASGEMRSSRSDRPPKSNVIEHATFNRHLVTTSAHPTRPIAVVQSRPTAGETPP